MFPMGMIGIISACDVTVTIVYSNYNNYLSFDFR